MNNISIIGVPSDYGQKRRGVDMGPSALRYAGLVERLEQIGYVVNDKGNISIQLNRENKDEEQLLNLQEILQMGKQLATSVDDILKAGSLPLVLGGDHSIAIGTLAGVSKHYENLGIIWFDAHADLNTPTTTPSGNIHGMPLAVSIGIGDERLTDLYNSANKIKVDNIVIIGARSIDPGERQLIKELGIKVYTMHEIDRIGMTEVMQQAITYLREQQVDGVHLSLDLDALDPIYTPGVGTPVEGGITYREGHLAMELLRESNLISSVEVVEVNPILDERNKTANVAVALMGSLFGETLV